MDKANEIRTLILYCLAVCLQEIFPQKYYSHFIMFSSALHILLGEHITENDLNRAESSLKVFVEKFETLYGKHHMVMNVHMLLHLVSTVRRHGKLWAQSAFPFYVVLLQLTTKYLLSRTLNIKQKETPICHEQFLGRATPIEVTAEEETSTLRNIGIQYDVILAFKRYQGQNGDIFISEIYTKAKKKQLIILLK